jgi:hypothetical protein
VRSALARPLIGLIVVEATVPARAPATEDRLIVPPAESSAARAQRFVRNVLADTDVDRDVANLAVLMTKALIINGILHARSAIAVTIQVVPESIRIEVTDGSLQRLNGGAQSWGMATIAR